MPAVLWQALEEDWLITLRCDRRREGLKSKPPCTLVPQVLHVPTLISLHRPDLPLDKLQQLMRCPKCGSTRVLIDVARSVATRRPKSMRVAQKGEGTLGTTREPWVVFECPSCGRRGEYQLEGLVKEFGGDVLMPSLLLPFAASRGCTLAKKEVEQPNLTRPPDCKIRYDVRAE